MPPSRSTRKGKRKDLGIDLEELAQQKARYFIVHAEEAHHLAADPTARDKAIAKLYQNPEVKKGPFCANTVVGPNDDPDAFLRGVDGVFENPARTIDQRVLRLHAAVSGLLVFNEHKLAKPLAGHSDLELKVGARAHAIFNEWMKRNLPPRSSGFSASLRVTRAPVQEPPTPPPSGRLPSTSMKPITPVVVDDILSKAKREDLLQMKFMLDANDPEVDGAWEVGSFCAKRSGEVVYNVVFEDMPDDPIPHDEQGMRLLLSESHVVL